MTRIFQVFCIVVVIGLATGCSPTSSTQTSTTAASTTKPDTSQGPMLERESYSASDGNYTDKQTFRSVSTALIEDEFGKFDWQHSDQRPLISLTETREGKLTMLQVRRNQSQEGKLHVAWIGMIEGKRYEGESTKIDDPGVLLELLLGHFDGDDLSEKVEWDTLY